MNKKSLPKPISSRALKKEYEFLAIKTDHRLDINTEKGEYLINLFHQYLQVFSNLYGYMYVHFIWDIFCDYEENLVEYLKVKENDFLLLTNILRLEDNPYYILDIDEVFDGDDEVGIRDRLLVNKELIHTNTTSPYLRFYNIYYIEKQRGRNIEPFVPNKKVLFSYLDKDYFSKTPQAYEMKSFINKLKVSNDSKLLDFYDKPMATRRLKNIIYLENWQKDYVLNSKQEWRRKKYSDDYVKPYADVIFETIKREILYGNEGATEINNTIKYILNSLQNVDVELNETIIKEFLRLFMDLSNNSHLWCLYGWTPSELAKEKYDPNIIPEIQFGSNMKKMFENGELDKDEIVKGIKEMGLKVYDEEEEKKKWS